MMLNMDRSQRLVIDTDAMEWQPSPAAGVNRKPLEREAAESGQVTSVVEYLPGSQFASHLHPMGEEIMVLDGVFEDENGRYPAGTYLRNPPGSQHAPASREGCRLLVKLNMFQSQDQAPVRIDTAQQGWLPGLVDGLSVMPLHQFAQDGFSEQVALVRWQPGTRFNPHSHFGGEEIFVLEGRFEDEFGAYPAGTWIRNPDNSRHQPFSEQGCLILVKTGHLARLQGVYQTCQPS
ncbi:MAG: cupin domain-containing protein [Motiliproteus sp.]|nr:cupin domain-containing protein [Motiliproteus sp.]MCW9052120.1 cupin domain-containing protein [Motiliproteus sp.]